jgi:hypothetical protein
LISQSLVILNCNIKLKKVLAKLKKV